jgi:ABC-2 type transport system permease protein
MGYTRLSSALSQNARVVPTDLSKGLVPADADLLLVMAPEKLSDKARFAIDQFLMRGGSVVLATSPFGVDIGQSLTAHKVDSGLDDWLKHLGVTIGDSMVLDTRDAALPVPVETNLGGIPVREIRMLPYPQFPDLRGASLDPASPITANLGQLTMNWASPITVDKAKDPKRKVADLLSSSPASWTSTSLDVIPDYRTHPDTGFVVSGPRGPHLLAVALEGGFDSYYAGKPSPLATAGTPDAAANATEAKNGGGAKTAADKPALPAGVIDKSPASAKLVVIASNEFASDGTIDLASAGLGTLYSKPLDFVQNVVDWSLEDPSLLALRGRAQFARTLDPLSEHGERIWEYANYVLAAIGLLVVWLWRRGVAKADARRYRHILEEATA